jgi:hypothetical protein
MICGILFSPGPRAGAPHAVDVAPVGLSSPSTVHVERRQSSDDGVGQGQAWPERAVVGMSPCVHWLDMRDMRCVTCGALSLYGRLDVLRVLLAPHVSFCNCCPGRVSRKEPAGYATRMSGRAGPHTRPCATMRLNITQRLNWGGTGRVLVIVLFSQFRFSKAAAERHGGVSPAALVAQDTSRSKQIY